MENRLATPRRLTTEQWAASFQISTAPTPPTVEGYDKPCPFTAREIALRALSLQGVVAVAHGVEAGPVIEWFQQEKIWEAASPAERRFLLEPSTADDTAINSLRWRQEAEWALLWVIGKVDSLGLPIRQCDTRLLIDEIIPTLGDSIEPFVESSQLRPPGVLLAEEDRHYDLWCRYCRAKTERRAIPTDLNPTVLYQREYAFEWLLGIESWDEVLCDA